MHVVLRPLFTNEKLTLKYLISIWILKYTIEAEGIMLCIYSFACIILFFKKKYANLRFFILKFCISV